MLKRRYKREDIRELAVRVERPPVNGQRMSAPIQTDWTGATPQKHSKKALEGLHTFAREHGIHFVYPTKFDGDIDYGSKGIDIARKAYYNIYKKNISPLEMLDYLEDNVSKYSTHRKEQKYLSRHFKQRDYPEVIPEVLAKNITAPNEFTSEFVRLMKEVAIHDKT